MNVSISPNGGVLLGSNVVCDGFVYDVPYRVQTHVHDDHMRGFGESKGYQEIYLTHATRKLLIAEFNADLEYRLNIRAVGAGERIELDEEELQLFPASHMLGAAQVIVTLSNGVRVGYSGDIGWPIQDIIKVDQLVIDSTNGSPESIRRYSQDSANTRLVELVTQRLRFGSVHITAHRGTLHRALQLLAGQLPCPIIASPRRMREISVFREFSYATPEIISSDSKESLQNKKNGRCVFVYSKGDKPPTDYPAGDSSIVLSAFMCSGEEAFVQYSESAYRVALSDHADYQEIIEYVKATGASEVLVDGSRGGHGLDLSTAICEELGIHARESSEVTTNVWGA